MHLVGQLSLFTTEDLHEDFQNPRNYLIVSANSEIIFLRVVSPFTYTSNLVLQPSECKNDNSQCSAFTIFHKLLEIPSNHPSPCC